jgi:hypothetical protein
MKTPSSSLVRRRALLASLVLSAATVIAAPQAQAVPNSGAGGIILNTITVNYKDASGTTAYSASATSSVTINLVKAGLTLSGMPTSGGAKGRLAGLPTGQTINSGATTSYVFALTANANGGDTYNLGDTNTPNVNMASQSVSWATVANDGTTVITAGNPATVALGASVIQANTSSTISIPGGSNLVAKIQTNATGSKVLVVNGVDYLVSSIVTGRPASNTNGGPGPYNSVGAPTSEILDVITLAINPSGGNVTPSFTAGALVGTQVGEQVLVKVTVTGVVGTAVNTPGTVPFTVTTSDSLGGNAVATTTVTTTFNASNLQIKKSVRNCGQATAVGTCAAPAVGWAATATGNPGDILEYKVEVINAGASQASVVSAQDAVPVYTSLITFTTSTYGNSGTAGSGLAGEYFAQVTDGATTGSLTVQNSDTEVANIGAGDAAGTTANSAIHFFLGTGTSNSAGGSIAATKTFTILYRMKVN